MAQGSPSHCPYPAMGIILVKDKLKRGAEDMITLVNFLVVDAKECYWIIYAKGHLLPEVSNSQPLRLIKIHTLVQRQPHKAQLPDGLTALLCLTSLSSRKPEKGDSLEGEASQVLCDNFWSLLMCVSG